MSWAFIEKTVNFYCVCDNLEWAWVLHKKRETFYKLEFLINHVLFLKLCSNIQVVSQKDFWLLPKRLSNKRKKWFDEKIIDEEYKIQVTAEEKLNDLLSAPDVPFNFDSNIHRVFSCVKPTHRIFTEKMYKSSQNRNNSVTILNDKWWKDIRQ